MRWINLSENFVNMIIMKLVTGKNKEKSDRVIFFKPH